MSHDLSWLHSLRSTCSSIHVKQRVITLSVTSRKNGPELRHSLANPVSFVNEWITLFERYLIDGNALKFCIFEILSEIQVLLLPLKCIRSLDS